ncbi:MAG TPA: hypothetical protein VK590_07770 [Saprospiraceae bacterium]|nr:hypothetical protein [Saprospiraceae bacterium]
MTNYSECILAPLCIWNLYKRNSNQDMQFRITVKTIYKCSLERAFKTPMLCDVSKVHTGFGIMPKVTHCTDGENWGKPGYSKKVFVAKSISFKGGEASTDKVIERIENKYWKIEVSDFKSPMIGFSKFVGEWKTTEFDPNKILVEYTYTLHSTVPLLYPLNWLFTKVFWKFYMKRVLENVREMAYNNEAYLYE